MFLPVKSVIDLHTKVFCFLDYFKLIFANFQIQVFMSTFEDIVLCFVKISMECVLATFKESLLP